MKKTYISPEVNCFVIEVTTMIAGAGTATIDASKTIESNNDIGVKANQQSNYDVWGDDWSK